MIDNGSSFYFQYTWDTKEGKAKAAFPFIKDHVLLPFASQLDEVNLEFKKILSVEKIKQIVNLIPEDWLQWRDTLDSTDEITNTYFNFLIDRLSISDNFTKEAKDARAAII